MTRVLVIDDNRPVAAAIQLMLARRSCDAVLALNAQAGMEVFESSAFDLVMIDIFMPRMDGLETIRGLRKRAPSVPIVAMSGFRSRNSTGAAPDYLQIAAKLGANYCLRKPFALQQLMAAIDACLNPAVPADRAMAKQEIG